MSIILKEGATPSFDDLPSRPRMTLDGTTLYDHKEASLLTGLSVRTLQVYCSHRRLGRFLGPKPTKVLGEIKVYYTEADLRAYLEYGHTGAPGEPNGDDLHKEVM